MKQFFNCFDFELKRSLRGLNLILAVLFALLALYFVNNGANGYNDSIKEKDNFKQIEKEKMEKALNYNQMGEGGFRVIYIPPPLTVFFYNSGAFSNLTSVIDIGERLYMETSVKGKDMFKEKPENKRDFSGLFFLFGTLLVLFYGFVSLPSIDYLKHLTAELGFKKVFFPLLFARFAIVSIFFIMVLILGILLAILKGISFTGSDYIFMAAFLALWLLLNLVLLAAGIMISRIKDNKIGISVILVIWILLVYFLPMGTEQAAADRANSIPSNFQFELNKWNELMNFEDFAKKELKKYPDEKSKNDARLWLREYFFKNQLLNIMDIEKKLEQSLIRVISFYQKSSLILPTTFYKSVIQEMSGKGYEGASKFLLYLVDLKYKFCVFIKNKRLYSDYARIEPFIKDGEENVFYAAAQIPKNYPMGMLILVFYAIVLIVVDYFLFKFPVLNMTKKDLASVKVEEEKLDFKKGESAVCLIRDHKDKDLVYCVIAGNGPLTRKKGFKGNMIVDGKNIVEEQNQAGFIYICDPQSLPPDSTVGDFCTFSARSFKITKDQKDKIMEINGLSVSKKKKIKNLEAQERSELTLALARMLERGKSEIYLFYNTLLGLHGVFIKRFKDQLMELKKENKLILYLSTNIEVRSGEKLGNTIRHYKPWEKWVDSTFELSKENKKEEQS
jgi:hypothetical protein